MRDVLILFSVLFVQNFFGQKKILLQEKERTVFIDDSKDSDYKKQRVNFKVDESDEIYKSTLTYLKKNRIKLKDSDYQELPKKFVELFQYKGKYYTYSYCDYCGDYTMQIMKDKMVGYNCEGFYAIGIQSYKKINNSFIFNIYDGYNKKRVLKIHLIDKEKGITIFEQIENGKKYYILMLDASKINMFPIIVNDCPKSKQSEFEFEKPDFKKLLNQK